VHGHDGGSPRRDGGRGGVRIEREAVRIDVREYRPRARHHDRQRRVGGGQGRRDDLVARADSERTERNRERIGSCSDAGRLGRAARSRELALERVQLRSQHEPAARDDPIDGAPQVRRIFARRQLKKRDHRGAST
jgi:hypothetical protein